MRDFDWFEISFFILCIGIGLAVLWLVIYLLLTLFTPYGPHFVVTGKVKALSYVGSSSSSGVGTGIGVNGQVTTVVTSNYNSAQHNVVLKLEDGHNWEVDDENLFDDVEQGDKLLLTVRSRKILSSTEWDLVSWVHIK